ncbi:MAG: hypothetical protein LBR75_04780 [Prevotellaceae bacterium]|nr:hypothetical protein [Prevotellaceae bacterium]
MMRKVSVLLLAFIGSVFTTTAQNESLVPATAQQRITSETAITLTENTIPEITAPPTYKRENRTYKGGAFENYAVALKAGTYGFGFDISTALHPNIKTRLGFSYFGYSVTSGLSYTATGLESLEDIEVDIDKAKLRFPNVNLLVDYYPWKSLMFHLTAGVYFGQNKVEAFGTASEPFEAGDYVITPDANGNIDAKIKLGGVVKPYFGIGIGRTIPKYRVGFRSELGIVYQGKLKVESSHTDQSQLDNDLSEGIDELDVPTFLTQLWPMLNFSITFRIK